MKQLIMKCTVRDKKTGYIVSFLLVGALSRAVWFVSKALVRRLLGAGVLGDGLGALTDGVLGQLSGEEETDGGLDLSGGDGGPAVVVSQTASLGGDTLEDVVDEGVHDAHGLAGDTSVGVNLLQHLVDVDAVGFPPPPFPLLLAATCGLGLAGGLLGSLGRCFGWHIGLLALSVSETNNSDGLTRNAFI